MSMLSIYKKTKKPQDAMIAHHSIEDWCHVCGKRHDQLVDVFYNYRISSLEDEGKKLCYVRICQKCSDEIVKALADREYTFTIPAALQEED